MSRLPLLCQTPAHIRVFCTCFHSAMTNFRLINQIAANRIKAFENLWIILFRGYRETFNSETHMIISPPPPPPPPRTTPLPPPRTPPPHPFRQLTRAQILLQHWRRRKVEFCPYKRLGWRFQKRASLPFRILNTHITSPNTRCKRCFIEREKLKIIFFSAGCSRRSGLTCGPSPMTRTCESWPSLPSSWCRSSWPWPPPTRRSSWSSSSGKLLEVQLGDSPVYADVSLKVVCRIAERMVLESYLF